MKAHLTPFTFRWVLVGLAFSLLYSANGPNSYGEQAEEKPMNPMSFSAKGGAGVSVDVMTHDTWTDWWQAQQPPNPSQAKETPTQEPGFHPASLSVTHTSSPPESQTPEPISTVLQVGDRLSLMVWQEPELSSNSLRVQANGSIDLPLIGPVAVAGQSVAQAQQAIAQAFKQYLKHPLVHLQLEARPWEGHAVFGAVYRPGQQQPTDCHTPHDAEARRADTTVPGCRTSSVLAQAGGVLPQADLAHITSFNVQTKQSRTINLLHWLANGASEADLPLGPGDALYVPRLPDNTLPNAEHLKLLAHSRIGPQRYPIRVIGAVPQPDVYLLPADQLTLQSVLAKAGWQPPALIQAGAGRQAKHHHPKKPGSTFSGITLIRSLNNSPPAPLPASAWLQDLPLQPYDTLVVETINGLKKPRR